MYSIHSPRRPEGARAFGAPLQCAAALLLTAILAACAGDGAEAPADPHPMLAEGVTAEELQARVEQFAPAEIDFDAGDLADWEKEVLTNLVQASDIMHELFLLQVSPRTAEWRAQLEAGEGAGQDAALAYFDIMAGPWDRLEHDAPFLNVGPKPAGAGYYAEGVTKEDVTAWENANPDSRESAQGYFSLIQRDGDGLRTVPYSEAYRERLTEAARLLREAAAASENASLTDYLNKRADAFLSDDYFESDLAWMDIEGTRIEPTIGPYETYEDALLGRKAAFESFVTLADSAASAELQQLKDYLPELERSLPIEDAYKNPNRSFESPIRVVDEVYAAGDTRAGVQTTAFNLPNDVRVHEQKGSKKVMLRNVSRAKFDKILEPIAAVVLAPELAEQVAFQPWFTSVVMHELAHGLGPTTVTTPSGERMDVRAALQELYSALEEAKADVTGLHSLTALADRNVYDPAFVRQAFASNLANIFRAVRFGTSEAHGKANLIQYNWLTEQGAIQVDEEGRVSADLEAVIESNRQLASEILSIQARGDYAEARAFMERYGSTVPPQLTAALERLTEVPVDIRPHYPIKERMNGW